LTDKNYFRGTTLPLKSLGSVRFLIFIFFFGERKLILINT